MNCSDKIILVIRIVDKNNVRMMFLKFISIIIRDRHIIRVQACFIIQPRYASIRVLIIVRYRDDIRITVWICISSHPYRFKRVPHGCFIWQEYGFYSCRQSINACLYSIYVFLQLFFYFICIQFFAIIQALMYLIEKLAISLKLRYRLCVLALCLINHLSYGYGCLLALLQKDKNIFVIFFCY